MALTEFQKEVSLRLNQGERPEAIADSLAVALERVLEAQETSDRHFREHPLPVPANWPTGPYTDEELRSIAEFMEVDVATVRATFQGAATRFDEPSDS
jgi:hypothetical protein